MIGWIVIFCAVPLCAFIYGWLLVGKQFLRQQWLFLVGYFGLIALMEVVFARYKISGSRFIQLLVVTFVVPWLIVHANEYIQHKEHSLITRMYMRLFPELAKLATVHDKLAAVRRARWKLLHHPVTAIGVCLWYVIPWLFLHMLINGQTKVIIVLSTGAILLLLFVGMHIAFRRSIRQYLSG